MVSTARLHRRSVYLRNFTRISPSSVILVPSVVVSEDPLRGYAQRGPFQDTNLYAVRATSVSTMAEDIRLARRIRGTLLAPSLPLFNSDDPFPKENTRLVPPLAVRY